MHSGWVMIKRVTVQQGHLQSWLCHLCNSLQPGACRSLLLCISTETFIHKPLSMLFPLNWIWRVLEGGKKNIKLLLRRLHPPRKTATLWMCGNEKKAFHIADEQRQPCLKCRLWIQGQSSCEETNKEKSSNLAYFSYLHTPGEWLTAAAMAVRKSLSGSQKNCQKQPPTISTDGSSSSSSDLLDVACRYKACWSLNAFFPTSCNIFYFMKPFKLATCALKLLQVTLTLTW